MVDKLCKNECPEAITLKSIIRILPAVFILSLVIGWLSLAKAKADEVPFVTAVCEEWEGYTNKDGTGAYWELLKTIYEPLGIRVQTVIYPWARAEKMVVTKKADILVGDYFYPERSGTDYLYPKWHMSIEESVIAVLPKKTEHWAGLNSLEGKRLGWIRGYDFDQNLLKGVQVRKYDISSLASGLKMLQKDRLDGIIDYQSTVKSAAKKIGLDINADLSLKTLKFGEKLYMVFSNTEHSRKLIEVFDQRMQKLVDSGEAEEIYRKWNLGEDKLGKNRFGNQ